MTTEVGLDSALEDVVSRHPARVAVVIGSTRPSRICPGIAKWFRSAVQEGSPLRYELVDLAEVNLPFLDEPLMAALEHYEHDHTRAWSRTVRSFDAFVFVFPQYNWGYPAPLKNALDFLFVEWRDKPVSYLTYGTRGGRKAAVQFREIVHGLDMCELDDHIEAVITRDDLDDAWQPRDLDRTLQPYLAQSKLIDAQLVGALAREP
jgi:NAD(P)H-dependent FMN reductase